MFCGDTIVGFVYVDGYLYGAPVKYANLTMLFVDDNVKRKSIGKTLFKEVCKYAENSGANNLFISAIPSVETVAFYFNIGCIDAKEKIIPYIDTESDKYFKYLL